MLVFHSNTFQFHRNCYLYFYIKKLLFFTSFISFSPYFWSKQKITVPFETKYTIYYIIFYSYFHQSYLGIYIDNHFEKILLVSIKGQHKQKNHLVDPEKSINFG